MGWVNVLKISSIAPYLYTAVLSIFIYLGCLVDNCTLSIASALVLSCKAARWHPIVVSFIFTTDTFHVQVEFFKFKQVSFLLRHQALKNFKSTSSYCLFTCDCVYVDKADTQNRVLSHCTKTRKELVFQSFENQPSLTPISLSASLYWTSIPVAVVLVVHY